MNVSSIQKPKIKELKDFIPFFLTGVLGASINFISQIFYRNFLDFDSSVLCGYLTGAVLTFLPNKRYAFSAGQTGNTGREMVKYIVIALVALVVQVYVAKYTLEWVANPLFPSVDKFIREKVSHLTGMGISFMANYFGHKLLTFRSTGMYDRIRPRAPRQEDDAA